MPSVDDACRSFDFKQQDRASNSLITTPTGGDVLLVDAK